MRYYRPMRRLGILILFVCTAIALEALYRRSNGLDLGWVWLAYRAIVLTAIIAVSGWIARRDAKHMLATGEPSAGILTASLALLLGGVGLGVWIWRSIDALLTGNVIVSTTPEAHTTWLANPAGFAMAFGLGLVGVAFFLLIFVVGILLMRENLARRRMPKA